MPKGPTPRLNALIAKVNAVCERRHGSKVELAEYLQTNKQQVHAMLKGENQPGGERVLALLEWLEKQDSAEQTTATT